jgi:hypothetical protein
MVTDVTPFLSNFLKGNLKQSKATKEPIKDEARLTREELIEIIQRSSLSINEVAALLGISRPMLFYLRSGKHPITPKIEAVSVRILEAFLERSGVIPLLGTTVVNIRFTLPDNRPN